MLGVKLMALLIALQATTVACKEGEELENVKIGGIPQSQPELIRNPENLGPGSNQQNKIIVTHPEVIIKKPVLTMPDIQLEDPDQKNLLAYQTLKNNLVKLNTPGELSKPGMQTLNMRKPSPDQLEDHPVQTLNMGNPFAGKKESQGLAEDPQKLVGQSTKTFVQNWSDAIQMDTQKTSPINFLQIKNPQVATRNGEYIIENPDVKDGQAINWQQTIGTQEIKKKEQPLVSEVKVIDQKHHRVLSSLELLGQGRALV